MERPAKRRKSSNFIENFISDPSVCRLYLGFSKLDAETGEAMRKAVSLTRLKAYSHVLDFFGGMFEIRDGKAVIPGGPRAAAGLDRTRRRLSRSGRRLLRQADVQGRWLARQPVRRARPHTGTGPRIT